jgi:hypothetical protein
MNDPAVRYMASGGDGVLGAALYRYVDIVVNASQGHVTIYEAARQLA